MYRHIRHRKLFKFLKKSIIKEILDRVKLEISAKGKKKKERGEKNQTY